MGDDADLMAEFAKLSEEAVASLAADLAELEEQDSGKFIPPRVLSLQQSTSSQCSYSSFLVSSSGPRSSRTGANKCDG